MFSAASSSSGRMEPPATVSSSSSRAEQPATPSNLKIGSIRDVQRWLAEYPFLMSASGRSAEVRRIREAVAVLSTHPKPRQEDVRPLQSKWQVAQTKAKKPRPLGEVLQELNNKVIKAAQKLQQQLPDSAEPPVPMDTAVDLGLDEGPVLAELRERQRKRAQASVADEQREAEQQRPRVKVKAAKRQSKRSAGTTVSSVDQPASKRPVQCLTAEMFAQCAPDTSHPAAASSDSAVQPVFLQQQGQKMFRLSVELKKLEEDGWITEDAEVAALKQMISRARDLQRIPAKRLVLRKAPMRALYAPFCGSLTPNMRAPF